MILSYEGKHPAVEQAYYIAPSADIIGDVTLAPEIGRAHV